ncbi:MAG: shikimate kinase [Ruminococcaceae bacterium]|nr:shikimate kinase [Oscillospiraceae bacterium]
MGNFYLIGMPGCGKSTIGKEISKKLGMVLIDADFYLEEKEKRKISDIFAQDGEAQFRNLETKYLKELSENKNILISTGGGVILKEENTDIMKKSGKVIFIDTSCENILKNSSLLGRPLLKDDKNRIYNLYELRYEKYIKSADYIYKNDKDIKSAVEEISKFIIKNR